MTASPKDRRLPSVQMDWLHWLPHQSFINVDQGPEDTPRHRCCSSLIETQRTHWLLTLPLLILISPSSSYYPLRLPFLFLILWRLLSSSSSPSSFPLQLSSSFSIRPSVPFIALPFPLNPSSSSSSSSSFLYFPLPLLHHHRPPPPHLHIPFFLLLQIIPPQFPVHTLPPFLPPPPPLPSLYSLPFFFLSLFLHDLPLIFHFLFLVLIFLFLVLIFLFLVLLFLLVIFC